MTSSPRTLPALGTPRTGTTSGPGGTSGPGATSSATDVLGTRVIAHRGDHTVHRENTLAAVQAAVAVGVDAVEVDVQLAADGTLVVVHDDTFERLWGDPRPVAATTWRDIARLGSGEERVPRLADLLELSVATGVPLVLDQKHPVAAMAAARLVERTGATSTAFCGSTEGLLAIRGAYPDATVYLNDASLQLPDIRLLAAIRPQYYNPYWPLLAPATVHAMRTFGIGLCCWTPNDDDDLSLVLDLGVDAVMTDRPRALRRLLESRAGARSVAPPATGPMAPTPPPSPRFGSWRAPEPLRADPSPRQPVPAGR